MKIQIWFVVLIFGFALNGCLQTREDLQNAHANQALETQVNSLQKNTADESVDYENLEETIRKLNGRIAQDESQMQTIQSQATSLNSAEDAKVQALNSQVTLLTQSVSKMDQEIQQLQQSMTQLSTQVTAQAAAKPKASILSQARSAFRHKQWKQAILLYQKYRATYPHGVHYAEATYAIGDCFLKLKMGSDAKSFFDDVISKYPGSATAKRASRQLRRIK